MSITSEQRVQRAQLSDDWESSLRRWGEDGDSGVSKKTCVCHENLMRDRVDRQGMGAVVGVYLIQDPISIRTILLNHRHRPGFSGSVNSMEIAVERDRVRSATDFERSDDLMLFQIKNHQFGISLTNRKEPSLLGINRHPRRPFARSKRPLPYHGPLADIYCGYEVNVFEILEE